MNRHIPATTSARLLTVALTTASLLVGAGTAYAYWEATGTGSGAASTGTVTLLTTGTVTGSPTNLLAPGGTGDLLVTVNNPNSQQVTVNSVALDPSGTLQIINQAGPATCNSITAAALSIVTPNSGLPFTVAGNNGQSSATLSNAVSMGNTSDTGCQGATFTIPLLLTGQIG